MEALHIVKRPIYVIQVNLIHIVLNATIEDSTVNASQISLATFDPMATFIEGFVNNTDLGPSFNRHA